MATVCRWWRRAQVKKSIWKLFSFKKFVRGIGLDPHDPLNQRLSVYGPPQKQLRRTADQKAILGEMELETINS
jgi:hypothetical protein